MRRTLSGSGFGFQHFHHLVGGGGGSVLLEIAGNDKDGVAYAYLRHAVRAAIGAVMLGGVSHRQISFLFISVFSRSIFRCAVISRFCLPVQRIGTHISMTRL